MTIPFSVERALLIAQQSSEPPWWLFPFIALIGLVMIGIGVIGIVTKKPILGRLKRILRLFGVEEVSARWAVAIGTGQCIAGGLILLAAITGPWWAGILADDEAAHRSRAAQPSGVAERSEAVEPSRVEQRQGESSHARSPTPAVASSREDSAAADRRRDDRDEPVRLVAGDQRGEPFHDTAPEGGLLVGLRCAKGKNWGGALQAIEPIYQVGTGYKIGQRHGTPGGDEHEFIAKPGFAVGSINARAGLALNALQLVFFRIDGHRLDPMDRYESDWVGCEGGSPFELDAHGDPITAVFGTRREDLISLGIQPTAKLSSSLPLPTEPPPDLFATPRPGEILGQRQGDEFSDTAPEGGVLVGVRAFCDESPEPAVRSLQPIYLVQDRYVEGRRHGQGGEQAVVAVARPGFAVGGMHYNRFGDAVGLRLLYVKITPAGPDYGETYQSRWLGYGDDDTKQEVQAGERLVGGITGYHDRVISGIGLMLVGTHAVDVVSTPPALPSELRKDAYAKPPMSANNPSGNTFVDETPEGGLLVGMRCARGKNWGGALQAVQPIYQVNADYVLGQRHGTPGGEEIQLIAQPGYAVGAINVRAGLILNALQLVFYRIDGIRLEPAQRYESDWVGCDGGGLVQLDPKGDPITGVFGSWRQDLVSLGIQPTHSLSAPLPPPTKGPPRRAETGRSPGRQLRTWRSADGKFTVQAKMLATENDSVRLKRRDGKVVTVPLVQLSPADVAYVRAQDNRMPEPKQAIPNATPAKIDARP